MARTGSNHQGGQSSIFGDKSADCDVHGRTSVAGYEDLDRARRRLAALYKYVMGEEWPKPVSDGDVIEYLARGEVETKRYLRQVKQERGS